MRVLRAPQRKTGANPSGSSWRAEGAKRVDGLTDRVSREGGRKEGRGYWLTECKGGVVGVRVLRRQKQIHTCHVSVRFNSSMVF